MSARLEAIATEELTRDVSCPECQDSGWQPIWQQRGPAVRRCAQPGHLTPRLARLGVPPRYQDLTFANFTPRSVTASAMKRQLQERAKEFAHAQSGLILSGPAACGKTHLAVGLMRAVLEQSQAQPRFADSSELLLELDPVLGQQQPAERRYRLEAVMAAEVLVLDDLAAPYPEPQQQLLDYIISYRYRQLLPVVITTRLTLPELRLALGAALFSRLAEMCETLSL